LHLSNFISALPILHCKPFSWILACRWSTVTPNTDFVYAFI
jgi:hypothetical protein